jgi:hypothetical protein
MPDAAQPGKCLLKLGDLRPANELAGCEHAGDDELDIILLGCELGREIDVSDSPVRHHSISDGHRSAPPCR